MSKIDSEILEDLTPGSVWRRENGKLSRVLFVTNQHFPEKILRTYPQQVVYVDEEDNVISTPVEDFVAKREFYNVDPDLEQRLIALLGDDEENFDLGIGDDTLQVEDDEEETVGNAADDSVENIAEQTVYTNARPAPTPTAQARVEPPITYQYRGTSAAKAEGIDRDFLASLTRGYAQAPTEGGHKVLNTLFIDAAPGVDQFSLTDVFTGDNATYNFTVDTASGSIQVDWDEFVGVYPMVAHGQTSYQVLFYTYPLEEVVNLPEDALSETDVVVEDTVAVVATADVPASTVAATLAAEAVATPQAPNAGTEQATPAPAAATSAQPV